MPDHARPLADRGRAAAPAIALEMARRNLLPERVLCSSAQRTRETCAALLPHLAFERPVDIVLTERLYHAEASDLLGVIREQGGKASPLLIIGHNPTLEDFLAMLGPEFNAAVARAQMKFPTAALAVITLPSDSWATLSFGPPGSCSLESFVTPGDLED